MDIMVIDTHLFLDNVKCLHKMVIHSVVYQGKGAGVYKGMESVVREALLIGYRGY